MSIWEIHQEKHEAGTVSTDPRNSSGGLDDEDLKPYLKLYGKGRVEIGPGRDRLVEVVPSAMPATMANSCPSNIGTVRLLAARFHTVFHC